MCEKREGEGNRVSDGGYGRMVRWSGIGHRVNSVTSGYMLYPNVPNSSDPNRSRAMAEQNNFL